VHSRASQERDQRPSLHPAWAADRRLLRVTSPASTVKAI
jgi:hypothetical protein